MVESKAWYMNGYAALLLALVSFVGGIALIIGGASTEDPSAALIVAGVLLFIVFIITVSSLVIVQPNEAKIITFFGSYKGTVRDSGLWMVVPFTNKSKVSLKVRNFNSQTLKVNDEEGNPIEIGAVVVYKVKDTAKASFDVDNYEKFVAIQSETAIRHIAAHYPYDSYDSEPTPSLRGNADEVATELMNELQHRLNVAGVQVIETRLSHLAYAQEIASAMLQRQQAIAIVAARQKIVEGAVGMVDAALQQLEASGITLDDERRAAMVNNLMVAIVSDRAATPVINAGSLYS
ncbi:regulator of protease activity HflC (stomatin/prohibitin superfamily) [Paenibacillus cellulosilyticus]|uniref:Regulator of protease activity HflC (Stomatin/prohibitin superfamily) n=1 Tax=Paenibacillus cellulosilyticus TaxID=375489 RepID=A0A2V2YAJ8_9BACL|nr:SPFH domain-containing protein [Paenibacillus cellulosilyticus]PWV88186.1 regulator of protease activity HflC (stomatin/prohibitin superfamily) [Paenibacillus cellulosilyticus]QKS44686.1 SPFH domain-containing protein [Paenibacillus cellulosilyticus]